MTEIPALPHLLSLPTELILQVLSYLEPLELGSVAQTCKLLYMHSSDDQIWQPLVNRNVSEAVTDPKPLTSFRELYIAHNPHWFLTRNRIWFADSEPSGKLLVSRYDHETGSIVGYAVVATRGHHTLQFWEKDREVIVHSFNPNVSLDLHQPVLKLDAGSPRTDDQPNQHPSDRSYAPPSRFSKEILMETFSEAGLYGSFMFCRALPEVAISEGTQVWPPLRFPAVARTRNETRDGFSSAGHRPTRLSEVSQQNFRLRKWVEYAGRRSSPRVMSLNSQNSLSAALGMAGSYFAAGIRSQLGGGVSIRMPEDITTYATIPEWCYTPTAEKPWQGIWCGDYSGHGCEFLVIQQPDKENERPLPQGMDWLHDWFEARRRGSSSSSASYTSAQEELDYAEAARERAGASELYDRDPETGESSVTDYAEMSYQARRQHVEDYKDVPSGRLEAIKLTGDPNIPRGEYTFIAPDIGHGGFMRIADEEIFRGSRIVRSAGHIAARGFRAGKFDETTRSSIYIDLCIAERYTPSQLIMISHDTLAQFWEGFGHISYYRRVDLDALIKGNVSTTK